MSDISEILETLAEPLQKYLQDKGPVPTPGALVTYQAAYLKETKRNRDKDYSDYSRLLDDVVAKKNA